MSVYTYYILFLNASKSYFTKPMATDTDIKATLSEVLGSDDLWAVSSSYFLK